MTSPSIRLFEMPGATGDVAAQKRMHKYGLVGIPGEVSALNYALLNIPWYLSSEGLYRQGMTQQSPGGDLYHFDVTYGPVPRMEPGQWSWTSDSTGGSIHISYSKKGQASFIGERFYCRRKQLSSPS